MIIKNLKANSAQLTSSVILALMASYWVTDFHKDNNIKLSQFDWFLYQLKNDYIFLAITSIFLLIIILALHNIYIVIKINSEYIPKLKEILSKNNAEKTPEQIINSFATLHKYFKISEIKDENNTMLEIIIKPIILNTYFVKIANAKFIIKFKNGKYKSIIYEEN